MGIFGARISELHTETRPGKCGVAVILKKELKKKVKDNVQIDGSIILPQLFYHKT